MYVDREDRVAIMYSLSVYKSRTGVKPGVTTTKVIFFHRIAILHRIEIHRIIWRYNQTN